MASAPGQLRVGRYFLALAAIFAVLYSLALWPGDRHTPRLGIDLVGGTQVTFTARAPHGQTPSSSAMDQAKNIMEDRVNGTGVTEATVVVQGSDEIVVSIPGGTDTDVAKLGQPAVLNFRGLLAPSAQVSCALTSSYGGFLFAVPSSATVTPAGAKTAVATTKYVLPKAPAIQKFADGKSYVTVTLPNAAAKAYATSDQTALTAALAKQFKIKTTAVQTAPLCATDPLHYLLTPTSKTYDKALAAVLTPCATKTGAALLTCEKLEPAGSSPAYNSGALSATQLASVASLLTNYDCDAAQSEDDLPNKYYLACESDQPLAYLLGPVVVKGSQIDSASAVAPNSGNGGSTQWTVSLHLKDSGDTNWGNFTGDHNINDSTTNTTLSTDCSDSTVPCPDFVAFTLNGRVISTPPVTNEQISGQDTQISGNFSQSSANDLANQLKYGALPLSFKAGTAEQLSATLGTQQLHSSFLAGGIGLALVILYSLIYYRALGLVTIASLVVSAAMTYAALVFLGRQIGFTLDLAGIAGFIVALGITADSFVVFFERLKDEVHEGRSVRVAVPRAWVRARRTILSADAVSFLAAAVLYYFASAEVKGFAFTLGMSTILDLVVVFLFTHPLLSVLSRLRAFGSPRFTGLNSLREGGITLAAPDESHAAEAERADRGPAARAATPAPQEPNRFAAVVVMDKDARAGSHGGTDDDADAPPAADVTRPSNGSRASKKAPVSNDVVTTDASDATDATDDSGDDADGAAPTQRRRTTPAQGSAAERAAARRARLRDKGDR